MSNKEQELKQVLVELAKAIEALKRALLPDAPIQPEPPLPMGPGCIHTVSPTLGIRRWHGHGEGYNIGNVRDDSLFSPSSMRCNYTSASWQEIVALARWVIEQEEARYADL